MSYRASAATRAHLVLNAKPEDTITNVRERNHQYECHRTFGDPSSNAGSPAVFILSCVYGDTRQGLDVSQLTPHVVSALFPTKRSAGGRRCVVHTDKKP